MDDGRLSSLSLCRDVGYAAYLAHRSKRPCELLDHGGKSPCICYASLRRRARRRRLYAIGADDRPEAADHGSLAGAFPLLRQAVSESDAGGAAFGPGARLRPHAGHPALSGVGPGRTAAARGGHVTSRSAVAVAVCARRPGADDVLEGGGLEEIGAGEILHTRRAGAARWRESRLPHARAFHTTNSRPLLRWCKAAAEFSPPWPGLYHDAQPGGPSPLGAAGPPPVDA